MSYLKKAGYIEKHKSVKDISERMVRDHLKNLSNIHTIEKQLKLILHENAEETLLSSCEADFIAITDVMTRELDDLVQREMVKADQVKQKLHDLEEKLKNITREQTQLKKQLHKLSMTNSHYSDCCKEFGEDIIRLVGNKLHKLTTDSEDDPEYQVINKAIYQMRDLARTAVQDILRDAKRAKECIYHHLNHDISSILEQPEFQNIVSSEVRRYTTEKWKHIQTDLSPSISINNAFVDKINVRLNVNSDTRQRFATTLTKVETSVYYTRVCIKGAVIDSCDNVRRVKYHTIPAGYAVNSEVILTDFKEAITSAGEQLNTDVRKSIKVNVEDLVTFLSGPFSPFPNQIGQIKERLNNIIPDIQKMYSDIGFVKSKQGLLHCLLTEEQASCKHHTGIAKYLDI